MSPDWPGSVWLSGNSVACQAVPCPACRPGPVVMRGGDYRGLQSPIPLGRGPDMPGCSMKLSCGHLAVRMASRGARRGASERRYQATASDVQRLKLLAEPHPAMFCLKRNLYGMQEVRGSNLLAPHFHRSGLFAAHHAARGTVGDGRQEQSLLPGRGCRGCCYASGSGRGVVSLEVAEVQPRAAAGQAGHRHVGERLQVLVALVPLPCLAAGVKLKFSTFRLCHATSTGSGTAPSILRDIRLTIVP